MVLGFALVFAGCGDETPAADDPDGSVVPPDAPLPGLPGLVASWDFAEGDGVEILDTSGVEPATDLEIFNFNEVMWLPGAIEFTDSTIARTVGPATKIIESLMATNEVTIEMWIQSTIADQGSATVVSVGENSSAHNLWAGTETLRYSSRVRFDDDLNGRILSTGDVVTTTELTHVVHVRDAGLRRVYVNGVQSAEVADAIGDFSGWDPTYRLSLGGEPNQDGTRFWVGQLHRLAIYSRLLSAQEVFDSFEAGATP